MSTRLDVARRKLGYELGGYFVGTGGVGGSATQIACTTPFKSTELPDDHLAYWWAFLPGQVFPNLRRVKEAGLDPTTGLITVDDTFSVSVANGMLFELSSKLPPATESSANVGEALGPSLNDCILWACRHIEVPDDQTVTLTLVNGQQDYSLSTWPFIDRQDRIIEVRELDSLGGTYVPTKRVWELRESGLGNTLHFDRPYRITAGTYGVKVLVMRPADTLVNGSTSTTGPTAESDTVVPDVNALVQCALPFAYKAMRDRSRGNTATMYDALYQQAIKDARKVRGYDHSNDIDPSVQGAGAPPPAMTQGVAA